MESSTSSATASFHAAGRGIGACAAVVGGGAEATDGENPGPGRKTGSMLTPAAASTLHKPCERAAAAWPDGCCWEVVVYFAAVVSLLCEQQPPLLLQQPRSFFRRRHQQHLQLMASQRQSPLRRRTGSSSAAGDGARARRAAPCCIVLTTAARFTHSLMLVASATPAQASVTLA